MYVMWNLENSLHNLHYVDLTLDSFGIFKSNEGQFHIITPITKGDGKIASDRIIEFAGVS